MATACWQRIQSLSKVLLFLSIFMIPAISPYILFSHLETSLFNKTLPSSMTAPQSSKGKSLLHAMLMYLIWWIIFLGANLWTVRNQETVLNLNSIIPHTVRHQLVETNSFWNQMHLIHLIWEAIQDKENSRMITNHLEAFENPEMEIKTIRDLCLDTLEKVALNLEVESLYFTGCTINLGNNLTFLRLRVETQVPPDIITAEDLRMFRDSMKTSMQHLWKAMDLSLYQEPTSHL